MLGQKTVGTGRDIKDEVSRYMLRDRYIANSSHGVLNGRQILSKCETVIRKRLSFQVGVLRFTFVAMGPLSWRSRGNAAPHYLPSQRLLSAHRTLSFDDHSRSKYWKELKARIVSKRNGTNSAKSTVGSLGDGCRVCRIWNHTSQRFGMPLLNHTRYQQSCVQKLPTS
jgi:hypothetical protein